jgi:ABC-type Zn uptake system ZnuABC Zn-binding protein ZnuA
MRKVLLPLAVAVVLLLALACGSEEGDDGKLRVVATTTQLGDFARHVGGEHISLTVLLKPNQDAHDFAPEPSQVRALNSADVILRNGVGLDTFVNKAISGGRGKVALASEGVALRRPDAEDAEKDDEDPESVAEAAGYDPHVWFSAANARRMVENVRTAFVTADPANASSYEANARAYLSSLDQLDAEIRARVGELPAGCRKLVTNHDVFGYFAEAYGFQVVGSVIPGTTTEAQASARDVAAIVSLIRQQSVPAIFAESSANASLVRQVAREAGVKVVDDLYGDSLGPKGSDGESYVGMMETNTRRIVEALKGCRA